MEPGIAGRGPLIGLADAPRIQDPNALDHFIPRHMSVAMKQEAGGAQFRRSRRDMDESAGHTVALEEFLHRPRLKEVIVSLHYDDRRADLADRFEGGCAADISGGSAD
jgi:hypothetical protein